MTASWGCAWDARRCARRRPPEARWRSDPRMRMVDVGGSVLRVLDIGDAGGQAPIILAADAPVVLEHLIPLVEALQGRRRVVALEMPGFGFSRPHREYHFTLPEQVGVLLGLLDALDVRRAHLAFTCVNALVAAALAKRAPERVERLTLGQLPSLQEYRRWAARIDFRVAGVSLLGTPGVGQVLMATAPSFVAAKWFRGVSGPSADPETYALVARKAYRAGGTFCLAALNQTMFDVTASDIGPLSVPTTFLWGAADRSHRATRRDTCLEIAPHADVRSFDDLGHCFDIEDPARVASLLVDRFGD
jgi:pimeloyl-ACP methyl ester carboxylesterase